MLWVFFKSTLSTPEWQESDWRFLKDHLKHEEHKIERGQSWLPIQQNMTGHFPGGPVVTTLHFHCRGHGLIPGQGTKIPQLQNKQTKTKAAWLCSLEASNLFWALGIQNSPIWSLCDGKPKFLLHFIWCNSERDPFQPKLGFWDLC